MPIAETGLKDNKRFSENQMRYHQEFIYSRLGYETSSHVQIHQYPQEPDGCYFCKVIAELAVCKVTCSLTPR